MSSRWIIDTVDFEPVSVCIWSWRCSYWEQQYRWDDTLTQSTVNQSPCASTVECAATDGNYIQAWHVKSVAHNAHRKDTWSMSISQHEIKSLLWQDCTLSSDLKTREYTSRGRHSLTVPSTFGRQGILAFCPVPNFIIHAPCAWRKILRPPLSLQNMAP